MIDRRIALASLFATGLLPGAIRAQTAKPRLAALFMQSATGPTADIQVNPFRAALASHGWIDGQNIVISARFAEGQFDRLPALAAELVSFKPDAIFTHTGNAARAIAKVTQTIPIVVGPGAEEEILELTGDLARPRTNVTGVTFVSQEMHEKCIELLLQAHTGVRRVAVLVDPRLSAFRDYPASMAAAFAPFGVTLHRVETPGGVAGLDQAFASLAGIKADALLVLTMPGFNDPLIARTIAARAAQMKVPVVGSGEFYAREGGLLAFGPDYLALVRRGAAFVDKILKGAKPADIPVERPTVFKLLVNRRTANDLGLTLPPAILLRADEVIE